MNDRKSPFFRQLVWAATLATGFGTIWTLLSVWILAAIDEARQVSAGTAWEQLVVISDGTPLIKSTRRDNLSLSTYRDLAGQSHDAPDNDRLLPGVSMAGDPEEPGFFATEPGWNVKMSAFVNEQEPKTVWYFMHDGKPEGGGYFVGYERVSNRPLGFIGLKGFRSDTVPSDEWIRVRSRLTAGNAPWSSAPVWAYSQSAWILRNFRADRWDLPPHLIHVPSGNRLQLVDLSSRTITTIFESPLPIDSLGIPMALFETQDEGRASMEQPILVRTGRQIQKLDHKYQMTSVFTLPIEIDRQNSVTWYEIQGGQAIAVFARPVTIRGRSQISPLIIYRIATDGTVRDRSEAILENGPLGLAQDPGNLALSLMLPAPAMLVAFEPLFLMGVGRDRGYPAAVLAMLRDSWPSVLVVFVVAFGLALAAIRRGLAFGLTKGELIGWGAFVFLVGVPAYVGFLLSRRWPIRLPCPSCHVRAPRDRGECSACRTPFPDPPRRGIEVFA